MTEHAPPGERQVRTVVQCSLGNVGTLNLPLVLDRTDLELVGLWVHAPEKHGIDAGTLLGREPTGVLATGDFEAIVALDADCVLYHSQILDREAAAIEQVARLLRSGKNVIVPWISALQYPAYGRTFAPEVVAAVDDACRAGRSSLMMTGTDPGFFSDMLPAVLTCVCNTVESIRVQEVLDYASFEDPRLTAPDFFCFGQPLEHDEANFVRHEIVSQGWGATAAMVAAGLGATVTTSHEFEQRAPAVARIDLGTAGSVEPGTIAARWFGITCETTGPTVTWEHITYVSPESIPDDWPVTRPVVDGYHVRIDGSPSVELHCDVTEHGNHFWGAYLATATRCTNVIDAVCRADPGIVTVFDLKLGDVTRAAPAH